MDKNIKIVCTAAACVSLILIALYFVFFHYGFSNDSNSWSNFGNYFNGILTPILTAVNIYVFIRLTSVISEIEDKRASELIKQEKLRSEKEMQQAESHFERELNHEKELLLMQLRKQEIDTFVNQMNRIYNYNTKEEGITSMNQVSDYLLSFCDTGFNWFNIEDHDRTKYEIKSLSVNIKKYADNLENNKGFEEKIFNKIYDSNKEITNTLVQTALGK